MADQFPNWVLNRLQKQFELKHNNRDNNQTERQQTTIHHTIHPRLRRNLKRTFNKLGIQVHFKGSNTIKQLLMAPKDKDPKLAKSGAIYKYKCPTINCTEEYIGELGRTCWDRYKEHLKAPLPIHLHTSSTGHPVSPDCFSIVDREAQGMARNIKETMYIRVNDPSLNRNLGKFQLPRVWDQILRDTPTLHLK